MSCSMPSTEAVCRQQVCCTAQKPPSNAGLPRCLPARRRASLGSIVASRGAALLAAPLGVLAVAAFEAGWWTLYSKLDTYL